MSQAKPQSPAYFFWHVSGEVMFHPVGEPEKIQASTLQCTIKTIAPAVTGADLSNATRGLMQVACDGAASQGLQIQPVQVTIIAVSGLGLQTDEEFFGPATVADGVPAVEEDHSPAKVS